MKVDYHVHLEEGPYSINWLKRTQEAYDYFSVFSELVHSKEWMKKTVARLNKRMEESSYSEDWLDLYLEQALRKGIKEVGIVEHLYRFHETRAYFERFIILDDSTLGNMQRKWLNQVMTERMDEFFTAIERAKKKWQDKGVILRVGMEADYFVGGEDHLQRLLSAYEWDYIIGSVHFVDGWGFDNPEAKERFREYDLLSLYEKFFGVVEKAIRSELFDFVAHLDNLKVFNDRPNESLLVSYYKKIANALSETDTATEMNAGLFYRYPVKEMCPSPLFLHHLIQKGVSFTLSSDSHYPDHLGSYIEVNLLALKHLGLKEVATFEKRKRIMKPI